MNKRIVVADDDRGLLAALRARLSSAGYEVVICQDAYQALRPALERLHHPSQAVHVRGVARVRHHRRDAGGHDDRGRVRRDQGLLGFVAEARRPCRAIQAIVEQRGVATADRRGHRWKGIGVRERSGRSAERLALEEVSRTSQERLELVIEGTKDGLWDWLDIESDQEWWSAQFHRLLGYEPDEIPARLTSFRDLLLTRCSSSAG